MAGKQDDEELKAIASQAAREATAKEKDKRELQEAQETAVEAKKAETIAQRAKRQALEQVAIAKRSPNIQQLMVQAGATGAGVFGAYKGQQYIASWTDDMVDDEGNPTIWRKLLVHGTFPVLGAVAIGVGMFMKNGLWASGLIGLGAGFLWGSLLRSVMEDEPLEAPALT